MHGLGRYAEQAIKSSHSKMKRFSTLVLYLPDNLPPYFYEGEGGVDSTHVINNLIKKREKMEK